MLVQASIDMPFLLVVLALGGNMHLDVMSVYNNSQHFMAPISLGPRFK